MWDLLLLILLLLRPASAAERPRALPARESLRAWARSPRTGVGGGASCSRSLRARVGAAAE
eukprot:2223947-Pyramimonas_sp.AAC.1